MKGSNDHPRFLSLALRDRLARASNEGIVVSQGLIAHGRGEAFDYILGEKTTSRATKAISTAAAFMLKADRPVISVNGNSVALAGREIVRLASLLSASIEVNLFHRALKRELLIERYLTRLGAKEILGVGKAASMVIPSVSSMRQKVDPEGIGRADVVLVPLEDGDRTRALRRVGKIVIAIDLNPLSRTSRAASVTIVDNIVRAVPALIKHSIIMRSFSRPRLDRVTQSFNNQDNLKSSIIEMYRYLEGWVND